jgi:ribosomal protein S6--L-glutamate ligase
VDILESASGPLLLEANSSPGLEGIERATGVNVAARIVSSLRARVREASEAAEEMRDTLGKNVNNPRWATESD